MLKSAKSKKEGDDTEELTNRQKQILCLMVKQHILTGEPISSKAICQQFDTAVSSATIRNEMNYLTSLGFLEQPHTSAGRVPTAKAYRMYVNGLLDSKATPGVKKAIDKAIHEIADNFENLGDSAGKALSEITGLPSVMLFSYVKRFEILPMGKKTVLLVLVTSDALSKSRLCKFNFEVTQKDVAAFEAVAAKLIIGTELVKFTPAFMQTLAGVSNDINFIPFFNTTFEMINDLNREKLSLSGEENLIVSSKTDKDALSLMEFISRRDAIISVLSSASDPISIVFGTTDKSTGPQNSMIVASHSGGKIGVIGPSRMSYEEVIPSIAYFASKLGEIIDKAIKDME